MTQLLTLFCLTLFAIGCKGQSADLSSKEKQDKIIQKYLKDGAWNHHYLTKEWDEWIDKGLQQDSTIAYLWQQKSIPFWKQKKYQLAIDYYDKAVQFDRQRWLARRGFLKCIFAKDYQGALDDLTAYKTEFGSTFEQDHSLEFYMGICHLQLNQFQKALEVLNENINTQKENFGTSWVHSLDRFYLAIAHYELKNYNEAIEAFDKVLEENPHFSDAQYYKSICLKYLGEDEKAHVLAAKAKSNFEAGNTFNEDSNPYEDYPYQVTWQWKALETILN